MNNKGSVSAACHTATHIQPGTNKQVEGALQVMARVTTKALDFCTFVGVGILCLPEVKVKF